MPDIVVNPVQVVVRPVIAPVQVVVRPVIAQTVVAANVLVDATNSLDQDLIDIAALNPISGQILKRGSTAWTTGTLSSADIPSIPSTRISDFSESVDDQVASLLQAGNNVVLDYNDGANTLTISATGGGTGTYEITFTQSNVSILNLLPVTHNLGSYPSSISVVDNTGTPIIPDDWNNLTVNSLSVDLSSFVPIAGTWKISLGE